MVKEEKLTNTQKEEFYRDAAVLLAAKIRDKCITLEWKSLFFFAISILAKYGMILAAAIILYLHGSIEKAILFSCFCIVYGGAQKMYVDGQKMWFALCAIASCQTAWLCMGYGSISVVHLCIAVFVLFVSYSMFLRGIDFLADARALHECAEKITEDTIRRGKPVIVHSTFRNSHYKFFWKIDQEHIDRLEKEKEKESMTHD